METRLVVVLACQWADWMGLLSVDRTAAKLVVLMASLREWTKAANLVVEMGVRLAADSDEKLDAEWVGARA